MTTATQADIPKRITDAFDPLTVPASILTLNRSRFLVVESCSRTNSVYLEVRDTAMHPPGGRGQLTGYGVRATARPVQVGDTALAIIAGAVVLLERTADGYKALGSGGAIDECGVCVLGMVTEELRLSTLAAIAAGIFAARLLRVEGSSSVGSKAGRLCKAAGRRGPRAGTSRP